MSIGKFLILFSLHQEVQPTPFKVNRILGSATLSTSGNMIKCKIGWNLVIHNFQHRRDINTTVKVMGRIFRRATGWSTRERNIAKILGQGVFGWKPAILVGGETLPRAKVIRAIQVQKLRKCSCRMVPVLVTEIYNEFIDSNATSPVNVDCKVMEITEDNLKNPNRWSFDEAAVRDRFLNWKYAFYTKSLSNWAIINKKNSYSYSAPCCLWLRLKSELTLIIRG